MIKNYKDKNIAVIGLGYVGLTLAVTLAEIGFNITGIEKNSKTLKSLKNKKPHFYEPGLENKFSKQLKNKKFNVLKNIPKINNFNVFIISVGTPLNNNKPNLDVIEKATKEVCETFNNNSLIIFRSTVPLGTTEKKLLKILKKSKKEFDLCFCPERTAQGTALVELRKMPQVIGGINNQSSMRAEKLFKLVTPNVNIVKNILTAELTKLIDNSQRDVLFAYANEIAEICNDFDISANEVLNAAALNYPRTKLLLPGPVGGPCLTKDSHLLLSNLKKERKNKSIISSARSINESLHLTCFNYLKRKYKIQFKTKKITLCFLGIAFKGNPITDDIRGSIVHEITNIFRENVDLKVIKAYDPNVKEIDFKNLNIKKIKSLEILFRDANVVIILNNNKEFKNLNIEKLSNKMGDWGIIYDFWGNFDNTNMNINKKIKYTSYGSHQL